MPVVREKVVVIGAGMGGLAAAARLAHAGADVTLLERAAVPGGKMRTVASAAGPVDAGPTVLTMRPVFEALFSDLGENLADHVTLVPEPILARHWWPDGATLDLHADPEASAQAVRALSGARGEREFRAFSAQARRLFEGFDAPVMRSPRPTLAALTLRVLRDPGLIRAMAPHRTLAGALAQRFTDPRLQQLFGRYATYVGGSPYSAPALLGLIWHSEASGVWHVRGGMHRLAQAMAGLCERQGLDLCFASSVARIDTRHGTVTGVTLEDGRQIAASKVLFNGDPAALRQGLLGAEARSAVPQQAVFPRSLSASVWSFAGRSAGRDLLHHNVFFGADPRTEFTDLALGRVPADPTLYVCAQDRGGSEVPPADERFEIILNAAPVPPGAAPTAVAEEAERCQFLVLNTLRQRGLSFQTVPDLSALTGPQGFATLFPGSDGSLYGRSPQGLLAAFRRPLARSALPGLYLAGGGTHPGAGIPMATLSGKHAAEAILSDLASTSPSRRTAMPGGTLMASATTERDRSASSVS